MDRRKLLLIVLAPLFFVRSDKKIMRWPEQDKELVTKTLSDRADGMYECRFPLITLSHAAEDSPHFSGEEGQKA
jgi:hypothetical protein